MRTSSKRERLNFYKIQSVANEKICCTLPSKPTYIKKAVGCSKVMGKLTVVDWVVKELDFLRRDPKHPESTAVSRGLLGNRKTSRVKNTTKMNKTLAKILIMVPTNQTL